MPEYFHIPVMLREAIKFLSPKKGETFIDCTLGGGGYTFALSEAVGQSGRILAIDLDKSAIKNANTKIKTDKIKNIILVNGNFRNISEYIEKYLAKKNSADQLSGIVLDLGLSSAQLDDETRGFSFRFSGPLSMNFDLEAMGQNVTAGEILNSWTQHEIEKILKDYGEEKFAGRISNAIVLRRKVKRIESTEELVEIIKSSIPKKFLYSKIHPATKTFQALRIAVNDEIENLKSVLPQAFENLAPGGRLVVISFHSLEDRIVKNFFREKSKVCICPPGTMICRCNHQPELKILTKKPLVPSDEEVKLNPRARSAKLRAVVKI